MWPVSLNLLIEYVLMLPEEILTMSTYTTKTVQANFSSLAASPDGLACIQWRSSRLVLSRDAHAKVAASSPAAIRPDPPQLRDSLDLQHLRG
jgi:hypothetical protein